MADRQLTDELGQEVPREAILYEEASELPVDATIDALNYEIGTDGPSDGEAVEGLATGTYPNCPPPTRFRIASQHQVRGRRLVPVSPVYGPSQSAMTVELCSTRTVTFGAEISGQAGWNIGFIEAQVGVKLNTSVTVARQECITFQVPKGKRFYLAAQAIYAQRKICRTAYGSAMCNPVEQCVAVNSPVNKAFVVAWSPA